MTIYSSQNTMTSCNKHTPEEKKRDERKKNTRIEREKKNTTRGEKTKNKTI